MRRIASAALPVAIASALLGAAVAGAATQEPIGSFDQPIYVTSDPADPDRLLVVERRGTIKLVEGSEVTTFLDLTSLVGCTGGCSGERGLMSIALAPDYSDSGHLYVFYAQNSTGVLQIDEFTASGDSAPLDSRRALLSIPHPQDDNHNGGQLQFGPEDNLFISTGDGGGGNDQYHQSQDLTTLLGKLLRIDPEPPAGGGQPYTVPAGNPFSGAAPGADEIWGYGLRNPFRFSFDRLTGNLTIGDVGQGAREEVDYAPVAAPGMAGGAGANYGWNCRQGFIAGPGTDLPGDGCTTTPFVDPVFDYPHIDPEDGSAHGCSITGGYVVRDASLGDLYGRYVYTDYCAGEIRSLQLPAVLPGLASGDRSEQLTVANPISFGEDSCGRIYLMVQGGAVSRLVGPSPAACPPPEEEEPPDEEEEPPPGEEEPKDPPPKETPPPGTTPGVPLSTVPPNPIVTGVRLRAASDKVAAGSRASLTARVLPCEGRAGQRVRLHRGGRRLGSAPLDEECRARFSPRVLRRSTFRVIVPAHGSYLPARSDRLTIEVR